jgi:hypothetical protein
MAQTKRFVNREGDFGSPQRSLRARRVLTDWRLGGWEDEKMGKEKNFASSALSAVKMFFVFVRVCPCLYVRPWQNCFS